MGHPKHHGQPGSTRILTSEAALRLGLRAAMTSVP